MVAPIPKSHLPKDHFLVKGGRIMPGDMILNTRGTWSHVDVAIGAPVEDDVVVRPNVPPGYEQLECGVPLTFDDKYMNKIGHWNDVRLPKSGEKLVDDRAIYIRPVWSVEGIQVARKDSKDDWSGRTPPEGYVLIPPGSRVQEGDLFYAKDEKKWKKAMAVGALVDESKYARPMNTAWKEVRDSLSRAGITSVNLEDRLQSNPEFGTW